MVKLDCIICTDEIKRKNLTALVCGHMYHTNCVIKLVKNDIKFELRSNKSSKEIF